MTARSMRTLRSVVAASALAGALVAGIPSAQASTTFNAYGHTYNCRDIGYTNDGYLQPCAAWLGSSEVGWAAQANLSADAVYVSLWTYNGPGNASFTGQSTQVSTVTGGYTFGYFNTPGCGNYLIGIGYWKGGVWYGEWESPAVSSC